MNFLQWLMMEKEIGNEYGIRYADIFYTPDKKLDALYKEFLKENESQ